jgi:ribosomal-protein-alanine acetyltransferase
MLGWRTMPAALRICRANPVDLPALVALEARSFSGDRLSPRQFRRHLDNPRAAVWVAVEARVLLGAAVVFFRSGSNVARLYSIAVDRAARGRGIGKALLRTLERDARARGCTRLRLEVRQGNRGAIRLYEKSGYRRFGIIEAYYEDGTDALRYQKLLRGAKSPA